MPVQREEVRVEREPITDANRDDATGGPDISEEEHEIVLHEEEVVVDKRGRAQGAGPPRTPRPSPRSARPSEEVRKEQIEADDQERFGGQDRR